MKDRLKQLFLQTSFWPNIVVIMILCGHVVHICNSLLKKDLTVEMVPFTKCAFCKQLQ